MKMASGEPLNDDDRKPWLQALNDAAFAMQRTNKVSPDRLFRAEKKPIATCCATATQTSLSST